MHFLKSCRAYNVKSFSTVFLDNILLKFQDFFFLCQNKQPTWLQLDHRKLGPSKMRLLSEPRIIKLKMKKKFVFMYDMLL